MPIYEYQCPDCGHRFEAIQKFSDAPITTCPACARDQVKKLISAASFVLKGSGWYRDHYGLKSGGGESAAPAGSADAGSSSTPATPAASTAAPAGGASGGSSTPSSSSGSSSSGSSSSGSSGASPAAK